MDGYDLSQCRKCKGSGKTYTLVIFPRTCPRCHGDGKVVRPDFNWLQSSEPTISKPPNGFNGLARARVEKMVSSTQPISPPPAPSVSPQPPPSQPPASPQAYTPQQPPASQPLTSPQPPSQSQQLTLQQPTSQSEQIILQQPSISQQLTQPANVVTTTLILVKRNSAIFPISDKPASEINFEDSQQYNLLDYPQHVVIQPPARPFRKS